MATGVKWSVLANRIAGAGTGEEGSGRAAVSGIIQAAHLAPMSRLIGPSSPPVWMVCRPSLEQMTTGCPGRDAAMAAKGIREPMTMANSAARKASERVFDQLSAWHLFTEHL